MGQGIKTYKFWGNFQGAEGGMVIFKMKIYVADFGPFYHRAFFGRFPKKIAIQLSENEGGEGSKAVWNFSENPSVLVSPPAP